jgi:5-methylcytosine-specific restriction enzyme subunit McrC
VPDAADRTFLPAMKTDITLQCGDRTLIIDTKWYSHTMQTHPLFGSASFISQNLYQIFAYVKNRDAGSTGNVAGMLLYAKTDEAVTPDGDFTIGGNLISLKTLDLGQEWGGITKTLESLCSWLTLERAG